MFVYYIETMTIYSLRITPPEGLEKNVLEEKLRKWLKDNSIISYVFCWEYGELQGGLHLQGAIVSDKKEQALRVNFKRKFQGSIQGNEGYSLKSYYKRKDTGKRYPCDEKLYWYVCKGTDKEKYEIALASDDHAAVADEYNAEWWTMVETVQEIKTQNKNESQQNKENEYQEWLKKMYPQTTIEGGTYYHNTTRDYVYNQLLDIFVERNIILSEIKFKNAYCYILSRVNPIEYREFLRYTLENKILF